MVPKDHCFGVYFCCFLTGVQLIPVCKYMNNTYVSLLNINQCLSVMGTGFPVLLKM